MASRAWVKSGVQGCLRVSCQHVVFFLSLGWLFFCVLGGGLVQVNLQSKTVNNKLHGKVATIGGHTVAVKGGLGVGVEAGLVDQIPEDFVQHGGPDGADSVDFVHAVDIGVGVSI